MIRSSFLGEYAKTIQALELLELTQYEADVYLTLLIKGDMKAGEIAKELKMHRFDAYNILKNLQGKELVEATLSKPMRFKAASLQSVLEILSLRSKETLRRTAKALKDLEEAAHTLDHVQQRDGKAISNNDRLQILSGRNAINGKWARLLASAESEILIATSERETAQILLSGVLDVISSKIEAGVKVNVYAPVTKSNAEQFLNFKKQIRHLTTSSSAGICIIDRRQAMIVVVPARDIPAVSKDENAVFIESKSIGEMLGTLFFVGWDTSPLVEDVIKEIKPNAQL